MQKTEPSFLSYVEIPTSRGAVGVHMDPIVLPPDMANLAKEIQAKVEDLAVAMWAAGYQLQGILATDR